MGVLTATGGERRTGAILSCLFVATSACADLRPKPERARAQPSVRLLWTQPHGDEPHPVDAPLILCFSGYLDPKRVQLGTANLSSGARNYDTRLQFELAQWREASLEPCPGSLIRVFPTEDLSPQTKYRLRLADHLRDWQGQALSSEMDPRWISQEDTRALYIEFVTGEAAQGSDDADQPSQPAPKRDPLRFSQLTAPGELFSNANSGCSCHQQEGPFDLRNPDRAYELLRFGRTRNAEPWVSPGFPSSSALFFKLLRDADGHALPGVFGEPMPPHRALRREELARIAQWIEDGALP